ncbi:AAA family ATPase [Metallibacterium sp.]|uniref:AAA family ATPase n=1 Tax=Metallibacterium sp. TaxID=2940281 RepID=UPI00261C8DFF|nr:AAA family ATPase [Metallibacterium sp.]
MTGRLQALRRVHPVLLLIGAVLALFAILAALPWLLMAAPGAAGAIYFARKHKPTLPVRHFLRSRGAGLTLIAGITSALVFSALNAAFAHTLLLAIPLAALALGGIFITIEVIEEHLMKPIMQLVPAGQQDALSGFLSGSPAAASGGTADLSGLDPATIAQAIKGRVIGQDAAVDQSVSLIFRRARLRRPAKPVCTLLYVGATGAGKTELAKAIAETMFGGRLIRVDCAEYTVPHSTQRLIGSPPGYLGSTEGGWLCREIGRVRTGVLLFDEIEKAHPDVMTTIMSLLDEARITEQSTNATYSATGFVIVLTSNAAANDIASIIKASPEESPERAGRVKDALRSAGFKPEVLARVDSVMPFGELSRAAAAEIVGLFLQRYAADVGLEIRSVDAALLIDLITKREALAGYGVREVVRLVESAVVDGLLEARDAGYRTVAISIEGDAVRVAGVA